MSSRHNKIEITLQMQHVFVTLLQSCIQDISLLSKCGVLESSQRTG